MTLRNFINRLAYYSYKEDRSNYVLHCVRPNECEDDDDCVEIRGDYIRRALATRFEVDHPQYPSLHIPYENVKEIVNLRTGRRIIFRHIPKEAQFSFLFAFCHENRGRIIILKCNIFYQ